MRVRASAVLLSVGAASSRKGHALITSRSSHLIPPRLRPPLISLRVHTPSSHIALPTIGTLCKSPALCRLSLGHEQRGCRISLCSFFSLYNRLSSTFDLRHRSGRSTSCTARAPFHPIYTCPRPLADRRGFSSTRFSRRQPCHGHMRKFFYDSRGGKPG